MASNEEDITLSKKEYHELVAEKEAAKKAEAKAQAEAKAAKEAAKKAAKEAAKEATKETKAIMNARTKKLKKGTVFAGIDQIWGKTKVSVKECNGAFQKICREQGYYNRVESYKEIVQKIQKPDRNIIDKDHVSAAIEHEAEMVNVETQSSNSGSTRRGSRRKLKSQEDETNNSLNSGSTSAQVEEDGASNASKNEYPDFTGDYPSSRAHMIPDKSRTSDCYKSYGIYCQAVLGVEFTKIEMLRSLAENMVDSKTNILRSRGVHGEKYDQKPCWIFVPICDRDVIENWSVKKGPVKKGSNYVMEGYDVLAIAGATDSTYGRAVGLEEANKCLCATDYNDDDEEETDYHLSRCEKGDLERATSYLCDTILAMAETLVGREEKISPIELQSKSQSMQKSSRSVPKGPDKKVRLLMKSKADMEENGIILPELRSNINYEKVEVLKFKIIPEVVDFVPDPMLVLAKAAVNWSWRCGQKLLPACSTLNAAAKEKAAVPSTPIPSFIQFNVVTPDDDVKKEEKDANISGN